MSLSVLAVIMGVNLMTWFWRYMNYLATWREHREAIKKLNRMTDRELRDIGMNRGDIDRLVWLPKDKQERGKEQ